MASVPAVLARLDRFEIDDVVRNTAAAFQDPRLRTLDAIHLATASVAASVSSLEAFVTYDSRLAKAAGAHVVATCSSAAKAALLVRLGADRVVDYKRESLKVC